MQNDSSFQDMNLSDLRAHFDDVLTRHILRLTHTTQRETTLPLNLVAIACLYLSVERENEIKAFPESPPERYTRQAFLTDLEEIGIEPDDTVMLAIQELTQYNLVRISPNDRYAATESAVKLMEILETIFPYMPGMSLVAYVSQSMDEVASGRKDLKAALQNFDQTLEKQGVFISDATSSGLNTLSKSNAALKPFEKQDAAALAERRAAHLEKLKKLREKSLSQSKDPAIVGRQGYFDKVEIREIFPKDQPAPQESISTSESQVLEPEPQPTPEPLETDTTEENAAAVEQSADIDLSLDNELELSPEAPAPAPLDQPVEAQQENDLTQEELIEKQIQAFESQLAMPCPVCQIGKILSNETEKGKVYYYCSNEECKLISWGKPYAVACPVCKNPFLIEFTQKDGSIGLKCPRATCQYRKKDFDGISLPNGSISSSGKKLVAVRKKKGKKGVRRVVRKRKK